MKRILSVWAVAARSVFWKMLLIVLCMAAIQVFLFWHALSAYPLSDPSAFRYMIQYSFRSLIQDCRLSWIFGVSLAALCAVLCSQGCQLSGAKTSTTLQRLPMREETVTLLWAALHAGCLLILWACELAVVFGLWEIYRRCGEAALEGQAELFISFYLSDFLHSLLPLADVGCHLRNLLWILSLGFQTAAFGYFQRRGRFRLEVILLLFLGVWIFNDSVGCPWNHLLFTLLCLPMAAITAIQMRRKPYEAD